MALTPMEQFAHRVAYHGGASLGTVVAQGISVARIAGPFTADRIERLARFDHTEPLDSALRVTRYDDPELLDAWDTLTDDERRTLAQAEGMVVRVDESHRVQVAVCDDAQTFEAAWNEAVQATGLTPPPDPEWDEYVNARDEPLDDEPAAPHACELLTKDEALALSHAHRRVSEALQRAATALTMTGLADALYETVRAQEALRALTERR